MLIVACAFGIANAAIAQDWETLQQRASFAYREIQQAERATPSKYERNKALEAQASDLQKQPGRKRQRLRVREKAARRLQKHASAGRLQGMTTHVRSGQSMPTLLSRNFSLRQRTLFMEAYFMVDERDYRTDNNHLARLARVLMEEVYDIQRTHYQVLEQGRTCASPSRRANPLTHRSQPPSLMTASCSKWSTVLTTSGPCGLPAISLNRRHRGIDVAPAVTPMVRIPNGRK
jgi:hypothetical protein